MINHVHERLEKRIAQAIGTMIVTKEIKHPLLSPFVSVTDVVLSKDKAYATVYISSFVEDEKLGRSVDALQHSRGYIQSRLGKILTTRNTPHLTFKADTSIAEAKRMSDLIDSLE
ncbi:MAG: 30S ribosome-binding factor RbfA [Sphaerochaetaceae bacterium]